MPVISKETLKAMKAFTDKLIEAGDINDGSVSGYFTRVRDDASYPQGVHDAAEEISKIFFNSKYPGQTSLFSELTQAKTFLDQMTADPNYPDGTPDAEEKCGVIMDVFKKYYDVYGDLAFYVNEFNKENNYVELGKRNSELRPLMPKINAYMNIDTFYSLFVLQSKNGNIENKVNNLRKTDRELNKLSGFMKYEKDIDLRAYEYKKLKTDYEDKEKFVRIKAISLEESASEEERKNYLDIEASHKTAQQVAVENAAKAKKVWKVDDDKVTEAEAALEKAEADYKKYEIAKANVGNLLNKAAMAKRAYENTVKNYVELESDRMRLKKLRASFNMDDSDQKVVKTEIDKAAEEYYTIQTDLSKWQKGKELFKNVLEKFSDAKYETAWRAYFIGPNTSVGKTYAKYYPKGTVIGDQIAELKASLDEVKAFLPDHDFFKELPGLAGDEKDQNGEYLGKFNLKILKEQIENSFDREINGYKDRLAQNKSYKNNEIKKGYEKQIRDIIETNTNTDQLPSIKQKLIDHVTKTSQEVTVNVSQVDDIIALEAKIKAQEEKGIEKEKLEKEMAFQRESETARKALENLVAIQKEQVKQNDKGIQELVKKVENGDLSQNDYNAIVANTFKTKEISEYHSQMVQKCRDNLANAKKSAEATKKVYIDAVNKVKDEKFKIGAYSYNSYRDKVVSTAGELQQDKNELKKLEGKYMLYTEGEKLYEKVENQRKEVKEDYKNLIGKENVMHNIYNQIETFRRRFSKCRKHVHENPTDGNSNAYNAIWRAMEAFGTREEFLQLSDAEVKQKLANLATAAKQYKIAKDNQWYHIDYFSTDKRYYRLNYANEIAQFCDLENALIGENGWELSQNDVNFINEQSALIPKYESAEEKLSKRFETYVSKQENNPSIVNQNERLMQVDRAIKKFLADEEKYRTEGNFIDETSDERTRENYNNSIWKTIYYIHAQEELHAYKPGETMEQRMQRIENLTAYEQINMDAIMEDKPENKKYLDVAKYYREKSSYDFEHTVAEWKKVTTSSIRHTMDVHSVEIEKAKRGKALDDRENERLEQVAARKNILKNAYNAQNNKDNPEQKPGGPQMMSGRK